MRSGEGKICSTEAEQMPSGAQRSWMFLLHHPGLSSPRQGQDNHEHGAGASATGEVESPSVDYYSGFGSASGCASGVHQSRTVNRPLPPAKGRLSKLWRSYSLRSQMPGHEKFAAPR